MSIMGACVCLRVFMRVYGGLYEFMEFHGCLWALVRVYGGSWESG